MFITEVMPGRIIGFDPQLLFDALIMGINLFILFFALSYLLFNPLREVLSKRKKTIEDNLADAENKVRDAKELKLKYETLLANGRLEANGIVEKAKESAQIMSKQIIDAANNEAASIKERTQKEIAQEKAHVLENIKDDVISISTLLANKVLSKNVDSSESEKLFEETVNSLGDGVWKK